MKALVIDDSKSMRMILSQILKDLGFQIVEAGNGKEALDRLKQLGPFDLALVDWNMPEMNGLEFVQAVRAHDVYKTLKMMMVTTETEMENVLKAMEAGANEYVMKPFTKDILVEKLKILGF